jgi:hypothetical protein
MDYRRQWRVFFVGPQRDHSGVRICVCRSAVGIVGRRRAVSWSFAATSITNLDSTSIDGFEAELDCADNDLFGWIIGGGAAPKEYKLAQLLTEGTRVFNARFER